MKGLKSICLENNEKLYLANSKDLIALIVELNLIDFYPNFAIDKALMKVTLNPKNMQYGIISELDKDL